MADMAAVLQRTTWERRVPALTYHNYRLWLAGRAAWTFAMVGQGVTTAYLVYELTHSTVYLGYYSFANGLPILLLSLYGGIVADRLPRRLLVLITQACWAVPPAILAILIFSRLVQPWHFIAFGLVNGLIYAFDNPARGCFVPTLVAPQDLANSAMLDNVVYYLVGAMAPALVGLIYVRFGAGWCFAASALAFVAPVMMVAQMHVLKDVKGSGRRSMGRALKEGVAFILAQRAERTLLAMLGMITLLGVAVTSSLLPAWAVQILGGDAATNGLLQSAFGIGGVTSALFIALLGRFNFKGKLFMAGTLLGPIMLLLFSQAHSLPLSLLFLAGMGMTLIPIIGLSATLLQILTPDDLRGRVMSMFTLVNYGMQTLGGLFLGIAAQGIGLQTTVVVAGSVLLLAAIVVHAVEPSVRALE